MNMMIKIPKKSIPNFKMLEEKLPQEMFMKPQLKLTLLEIFYKKELNSLWLEEPLL